MQRNDGRWTAGANAGSITPDHRRRRVALVTAGMLGASMVAVPPGAADSEEGTVEASVEAAEPVEACVLLTVSETDFGLVDFGGTGDAPPYEVQSCSDAGQSLFGAATDAVGEETTWHLDGDGDTGENRFAVDAATDDHEPVPLGEEAREVGQVEPDPVSVPAAHTLSAPDVGSDGGGEVLDFDLGWTAVVEPFWAVQEPDNGAALTSAELLSRHDAVAVGARGTVLITDDGGNEWAPVNPDVEVDLRDVAFADRRTGVIVGDGDQGLRTTDAGQSWEPVAFPGDTWSAVDFADDQVGVAVGPDDTIARTTDAGQRWEQVAIPGDTWSAVAFADAQTGVIVGDGGEGLRTTDAGQTWEPVAFPGDTWSAVDFANDQVGGIVGENGQAAYTRDGGESWRDATFPGDTWSTVADVVVNEHGDAFVAAGEQMFRSDDRGQSWVEDESFPGDTFSLGIAALDTDVPVVLAPSRDGALAAYR